MKTLIFFAVFGLALATAEVCPPSEVLSPCFCFESNKTIECKDIRGRFNLKNIFDRAASSVGDDVIFGQLTIQNTPAVEIEDGTFETWKFVNISITNNENLVYISPVAFNAGRNVTQRLDIVSNAEQEGDIFEVIRSFENLVQATIRSSGLTSLPDNAFQGLLSLERIYVEFSGLTGFGGMTFSQLPNLKTVLLQGNAITEVPSGAFENLTELVTVNLRNNKVTTVGSRAFFQTENINLVDLYGNDMSPEGHDPDAFLSIGNDVGVDMTYNNRISYLDQQSFQPLLERARRVTVGGGGCSRNGCTYRYLYCDERADWICDKMEHYQGKFSGFRCLGGLGMIEDFCASKIITPSP